MRNPFRRRNNNQTIAELESYYATQGSTKRTGTAWFMAIISLLITVAVIILLYFGVRWVYRTVTDNTNDSDTVATGTVETDGGGLVISGDSSTDPRSSEDVLAGVLNPSDSDESSSSSSASEEEGVVSDEAASTTREVAGESDSIAVTGGGDELPSTGAGESAFAGLVLITVFGYFVSRKRQLTK